MRRLFVILLGLVILVFIVVIVMFGLESPEVPVQEVHKVFPASKFEIKSPVPALPAMSGPPASPLPAQQMGQPASAPAVAPMNGNVASPQLPVSNPVSNTVPANNLPASNVPPNTLNQPAAH